MIKSQSFLNLAFILVLISCSPNKSYEQQPQAAVSLSFDIPFGPTVSNDGVASAGEWDLRHQIPLGAGDTFFIKHDGLNLCVGYKRSSARLLFPELLIDQGNSKAADWVRQQWYHVSGTDCFSDLQYADYGTSSCAVTFTDWDAQPNFMDPRRVPEFIEIKIPFNKLQINYSGGERELGIAFALTDAQNPRPQVTWPESIDVLSPATWGTGILQ